MNRRDFFTSLSLTPIMLAGFRISPAGKPGTHRLFFISKGQTFLINSDGTGLRNLSFNVPGQVTWQPAGFFSDGHRVLFLSMEARRDGPGKPFDEYYTQTPTHLWIYDIDSGSLSEIATKGRLAVFYTPQLLINDEKILVQVVRHRIGQIFSMNLDGSDAREFTKAGDGLPYGLHLSPDGKHVAYHLASPKGYQIWVSDINGDHKKMIVSHPDHLYFCPRWSPDGEWLTFEDCLFRDDPGHDWADICLCRPDGSELRQLTKGQIVWFAATYGPLHNRGGGSNVLAWSQKGEILFPRRIPGSRVAWEYQSDRPDTDHFNRDYKPESSCGGTEICRLNPRDGAITRLTCSDPPVWDFRSSESPDGRQLTFCRASTGDVPVLYVANSDGKNPQPLNKGLNESGVDHPQWLPAAAKG
jgi:Tol biopolymer transport system component